MAEALARGISRPLSRALGGDLGGVAANVLRVAEVNGRLAGGVDSVAGTDRFISRWPMVLGANCTSLVLAFDNRYMGTATELNPTSDITIIDASIEAPNGTVVPVRFSGARNTTLTAGTVARLSDEMTASAFGYAVCAQGAIFWVKVRGSISTLGGQQPFTNLYSGDFAGSQAWRYADAATTPSSTDAAGVYTSTGTAPTTRIAGYKPILLGRMAANVPVWYAWGDSITRDVNDGTASVAGRGYFSRALYNSGTNPRPGLNASVGGITALYFNGTRTLIDAYLPYVNRGWHALGTNDTGSGASVATMQTRILANIASMRSTGHITKVVLNELLARTTSTDNWATSANQTAVTNWGAGGNAQQLNTWMNTLVGTTVEAVQGQADMRDTTDTWKWRTNGSANFVNSDDTHPNSNGHSIMAASARTTMLAQG